MRPCGIAISETFLAELLHNILFTFSGKNEKEFEFFGVIFGYYFNNRQESVE